MRAGAIGPVGAAITELAVAPLPLAPPRGGGAEPDPDAVERYARGVLSALARTGQPASHARHGPAVFVGSPT